MNNRRWKYEEDQYLIKHLHLLDGKKKRSKEYIYAAEKLKRTRQAVLARAWIIRHGQCEWQVEKAVATIQERNLLDQLYAPIPILTGLAREYSFDDYHTYAALTIIHTSSSIQSCMHHTGI